MPPCICCRSPKKPNDKYFGPNRDWNGFRTATTPVGLSGKRQDNLYQEKHTLLLVRGLYKLDLPLPKRFLGAFPPRLERRPLGISAGILSSSAL
jgi:hypothetical protein